MSATNRLGHVRKIAVIGAGYVGLPVAAAFARTDMAVVAFDINGLLRNGTGMVRDVKCRLPRGGQPAGVESWRL